MVRQQTSLIHSDKNKGNTTKSNVERDLLEGHMAREFFHEDKLIFYLSARVCRAKQEMYNFQQMLTHSFPDLAHEFILQEEDTLVKNAGEALIV